MDVKEAVAAAKSHVAQAFADEALLHLGLEEVRFDDEDNAWLITLGFSREWTQPNVITTALGRQLDLNRTYKVVRISNETAKILSMTDRFLEAVG